jgi:hypothetical protein
MFRKKDNDEERNKTFFKLHMISSRLSEWDENCSTKWISRYFDVVIPSVLLLNPVGRIEMKLGLW